jgi:peroxidase
MHDDDIGYTEENFDLITFSENLRSEFLNTAARLIADGYESELKNFESFAGCLGRVEGELRSWPKYRAINGYGNNLKHPFRGTKGTPFARFGPKSYDDGVHSIRKSVTGSDLPSPRRIVLEVLLKAQKTTFVSPITPNAMLNLIVLYITHDLAHQVPVESFESNEKIRCCSHGNKAVLSSTLSHPSCLPISIGKNDSFYGPAGVRCLNLVRSELSSLPSKIQYGEVMNKATAFMDHSIIYGTEEAETNKVRSFVDGKLNVGVNGILPTDSQGRYTVSTDRLTAIPLGSIFAVMFTRNHNNLAANLKIVNPLWDDEKLFQEARRINIALFQKFILKGRVIESVAKKRINETYNENFDASTTLEFSTAAYRFLHYFLQPDMQLIDANKNVERILISDTLGRIDLIEKRFDDALRGILNQPANFGEYSDEVSGKWKWN